MADNEELWDCSMQVINSLRNHLNPKSTEYHQLLHGLYEQLFALFRSNETVARHILLNLSHNPTSTNKNQFEYPLLTCVDVASIQEAILVDIYPIMIPRLSYPNETYGTLHFLNNLLRKVIVKTDEEMILRSLSSLILTCDKRCIKIVLEIISHILNIWDNETQRNQRLNCLLSLPKWGKVEFYICKVFFSQVETVEQFKIVMERIFCGFTEKHNAHPASVLFDHVMTTAKPEFFDIIKADVKLFLVYPPSAYDKTFQSSILTYIIPAMCDTLKQTFYDFAERHFHSNYYLVTMKYCYLKGYIESMNLDDVKQVYALYKDKKYTVMQVWESVCSFIRPTPVTYKHLRLFKKLITRHYYDDMPSIKRYILLFLSQVAISGDSIMYTTFFTELKELAYECANYNPMGDAKKRALRGLIEVNICFSYLLNHDSSALKLKYELPRRFKYEEDDNPLLGLDARFNYNGALVTTLAVNTGISNRSLEVLITYTVFKVETIIYLRSVINRLITSPNLENLETIRNCTLVLIQACKHTRSYDTLMEVQNELLDFLMVQFDHIKQLDDCFVFMANPVYSTIEALNLFARRYLRAEYDRYFACAVDIVNYFLSKIHIFTDVHTKKYAEHVLISIVRLMIKCVKYTHYKMELTIKLYSTCVNVMCLSTLRKATTFCYNTLIALFDACEHQLTNNAMIELLLGEMEKHLEAIEKVPFNRCSGDKEMILLCFRELFNDKIKFRRAFEGLLETDGETNHYHALTILCNDNLFKHLTAPYLTAVFRIAIKIPQSNFMLRNVAVQLMNVLANRLLGTKSELGQRQYCVHRVFEVHREIFEVCEKALIEEDQERMYGVLTFMAEAPCHGSIFGEVRTASIDRENIEKFVDVEETHLVAIKASAMSVRDNELRDAILDVIAEVPANEVVVYKNVLMLEYLLRRYEHLQVEYGTLKDIYRRIKAFLNNPAIINSPLKILYADCFKIKGRFCKLMFAHRRTPRVVEVAAGSSSDIGVQSSKCIRRGTITSFIVLLNYAELIFRRLNKESRLDILLKLFDVFLHFPESSSLSVTQFYTCVKRILSQVPLTSVADNISMSCDRINDHIYLFELFTSICSSKTNVTVEEKRTLANFVKFLPSLLNNPTFEEGDSVIIILENLWSSRFKFDVNIFDYFHILVVSLLQIDDKRKFSEILRMLTGENDDPDVCVRRLFDKDIIKRYLKEEYVNFVQTIAVETACIWKFDVQYTALFSCPEQIENVKIEYFLIKQILIEFKYLHKI